jgi:hypothetical protein
MSSAGPADVQSTTRIESYLKIKIANGKFLAFFNQKMFQLKPFILTVQKKSTTDRIMNVKFGSGNLSTNYYELEMMSE